MGIFSKKNTDQKPTPAAGKKAPAKEKADKAASAKASAPMKKLYQDSAVKSPKETGSKKAETVAVNKRGNAYRILVKPLITEKAANVGTENKYVFAVQSGANKIEIAKAINDVYGVKPTAVNVLSVGGKKVRYGRRFGQRKDWKKAIVTLPAGKTINIYEGV